MGYSGPEERKAKPGPGPALHGASEGLRQGPGATTLAREGNRGGKSMRSGARPKRGPWLRGLFCAVVLVPPTACTQEPTHREAPPCVTDIQLRAELGRLGDSASVREPVFVDIAPLKNRGWVVAEDGNELIEYGSDGTFVGFFGARGEGPGEILSPTRVAVDAWDSVWVSEDRGRVVVFSPDGNPARSITHLGIFRIDGFTPSGLPFSMLTRDSGGVDPTPSFYRYAQVWNREATDVKGWKADQRVGGLG